MKKRGKYGQWKITGEKKCFQCLETKPISDFYWKVSGVSLFSACKICKLLENKNRRRAYSPERIKRYQRISFLRSKWGLEVKDYEKMLAAQSGVCAVCGSMDRNKRLAVDHCHKTKTIRGLLCSNCNTAMGKMKDSLPNLQRAMDYLRSHGIEWS